MGNWLKFINPFVQFSPNFRSRTKTVGQYIGISSSEENFGYPDIGKTISKAH